MQVDNLKALLGYELPFTGSMQGLQHTTRFLQIIHSYDLMHYHPQTLSFAMPYSFNMLRML